MALPGIPLCISLQNYTYSILGLKTGTPKTRFLPLHSGAAISTPAISTPAFLLLPRFPLPRFQSPPENLHEWRGAYKPAGRLPSHRLHADAAGRHASR